MFISGITYESLVDGKGVRTTLFISGCYWNCKGCHNKETHSFMNGKEFTLELQQEVINNIKKNPLIKGLTLSGGDPMFSAKEVLEFIAILKKYIPDINIWCYTGFTFEGIVNSHDDKYRLLKQCDVLVDGQFKIEMRNIREVFKGSSNQRIINVKESLKQDEIILYKMEELDVRNKK